jgi:hypothetical protein
VFFSKRENKTGLLFEGGGDEGLRPKTTKRNRTTHIMKKRLLRGIAVAAMIGLSLTVWAQDPNIDQSQYPTILEQPIDQCLPLGSSATFSVVATNVDSYQWYKNNVAVDGATNSSLTISNLSTDDAAYYGAATIKGSDAVPTRLALLNVYMTTGSTSTTTSTTTTKKGSGKFAASSTMMTMSANDYGVGIVVFSPPVFSSGTNSCCGAYSGYVNYLKPPTQGWGFYSDTNTTFHAATDNNRSDTKVTYIGSLGDGNCGQSNNVIIPDPTGSPKYRFSIYFPRGCQVPTNSYPITLDGFNP